MQKRKLQVFVSSTYRDLIKERQAAVEAILSAGHIPAGMELFAAGDQSQWEVIKEWIEESDVYMLILGGRYGSIEQKSGKSYTQLEYEYAIEIRKPFFAVVITEEKLAQKAKEEGLEVVERESHALLQNFKDSVTSKLVRFWDDIKDIKIAIHETLNSYSRDENLIGWIPGNQGVNGAELAEEIARLAKENSSFRERIIQYESVGNDMINGMPMMEFIQLLKSENFKQEEIQSFSKENAQAIKNAASDEELNLFHVLCGLAEKIDGVSPLGANICIKKLSIFGLIKIVFNGHAHISELTDNGRKLFMYLKQNNLTQPIAEPGKSGFSITYG